MTSPAPHADYLRIQPYKGGEATIAGRRAIKLSSNEGAFGAPPAAREAFAAMAADLHRYPDGGTHKLREALGARWGLDPDRIVCGAGSDDIIYKICQAYGGPGSELIMTRHGFSIYRIAGQLAHSTIVEVPETDLTADIDAILKAVTPRTKSVFLANPNNPTGTMVPAAEIHRLRAELPSHVLLVLDSAYAEYVTRPDYTAGVDLVDAGDNTVMTRTFSKIFGLGGMRLGWAYAPPAVVDVLNRVREPFNCNIAVQAAGVAALHAEGWVEMCAEHNIRERARLRQHLESAGLKVWPSEGNFLLVDFGSAAHAEAADRALRAEGLIVRPVGGYHLPNCLRMTVGTTEECAMLASVTTEFWRNLERHVA